MPAPTPAPHFAHAHPTGLDAKRLARALLERSWLIAIFVVLAALLTIGYTRRQPILYAASATVQIEQDEARVIKVERFQAEDLRFPDAMRTIEQTLKSRAVLDRVVDKLRLTEDASFLSTTKEPDKAELTAILDRIVSVRLRKGTRLMDVTVTHPNPQLTAKIANAVVTEFIANSYEQSSNVAEDAASFLAKEGHGLKRKVEESEKALQAFRDKSKSVSLEERNDIVNSRLKEVNANLTEANSAAIRLKTELAQVDKLGTNVAALLVLPVVNSAPNVAEAKGVLSKLEGEFASLKQRYKESHPKYLQHASEMATWRDALTNAVLKVPPSLRSAYESAAAGEKALQDELAKQETISRELTKQLTEYQRLARELDGNRTLYDAIQQRLKEATLTRELKPSKVQMNTTAITPGEPFSPKKNQLMIRGLLLGLVAGVLVVLGLNALNTSIQTVDDAEEYLRLPVLASVPKVKVATVLVVTNDAKSSAAEAFRTLRTSVSMLGRPETRRTFLLTSAIPQEGKTFCSLNFALALSQQGLKTVIIDGDLRRPSIEKYLAPDSPRRTGVTDYLTGASRLDQIIHDTGQKDLHYIPAGTLAPNPAELLAQGNFDHLIEEALLRFDRVVVDSAPVHAVSDTLLMLKQVQTVCLVVRACKTPRKAVGRARELLEKASAPLAGTILNLQPRRRLAPGYDPYYTYSYDGKYSEKGVYGS